MIRNVWSRRAAATLPNAERWGIGGHVGASKTIDPMAEAPVTYDAKDGVAWITLNRPAVLNALNTELAATLAEQVDRAGADPAITVVVVRGAGRAFCSGMDRTNRKSVV